MTDPHDEQLPRLAQVLKTTQAQTDDPFRRLAEALVPDDSYSHEQAEQDLPLYVADELLGRAVGQTYATLHRHLLTCQQCAALHVAMLEDLAEEPAPIAVPLPRLDFLPELQPKPAPYINRLRDFSLRFAQPFLKTLDPRSPSTLPTTAKVYFDQVGKRLGDFSLQTSPQAAFGFHAEPSLALRVLAATAATTYQLGHDLSAERIATLRAENRLETTVQRTAMQVASDMRLGREAGPFAIQYTQWLLQQIAELPRK